MYGNNNPFNPHNNPGDGSFYYLNFISEETGTGGLKRLIGGLTAAKWQARMQTQEIWLQNMCWEPLCCEFNIYLLNKQIVE